MNFVTQRQEKEPVTMAGTTGSTPTSIETNRENRNKRRNANFSCAPLFRRSVLEEKKMSVPFQLQ